MQKLFLQIPFIFLTALFARGQSSTAQFDTSQWVFTSLSGPTRNVVIYAPKPVIPPAAIQQHLTGSGVYKMDLDNGAPYDVRVICSTGNRILDDAAVEALRQWRFLPHRMEWVTIPIEFGSAQSPVGKKTNRPK